MPYRVTGKQPNSKMCLVCGLKNSAGLKAHFYELENGEIVALFTALEEHQSYPGRLHGGIATAILDETIGRAILTKYGEMIWGVTTEFSVRFRRPVPLNEELQVVGRITQETERHFEGTGEILLSSGKVAVEGYGKYAKLPLEKIADFDIAEQEWRIDHHDDDPTEFELGTVSFPNPDQQPGNPA
ncbi:MAG: PaaI family thioesterase [Anaerolineae bacterium]|nr:PaaI family thioesterase [Anaerolineae bacterium]